MHGRGSKVSRTSSSTNLPIPNPIWHLWWPRSAQPGGRPSHDPSILNMRVAYVYLGPPELFICPGSSQLVRGYEFVKIVMISYRTNSQLWSYDLVWKSYEITKYDFICDFIWNRTLWNVKSCFFSYENRIPHLRYLMSIIWLLIQIHNHIQMKS